MVLKIIISISAKQKKFETVYCKVTKKSYFFNYFQISSFSGQTTQRAVSKSAALMAAFGIGVSSFSVKQMMNSGPRRL